MVLASDATPQFPEERQFRDYMTRGDDFCKIELYRQAVGWYRKAVHLRPGDADARQRLEGCSAKIKQENRVIAILAAIGALVVTVVILARTM
jgi:hypothetical protein